MLNRSTNSSYSYQVGKALGSSSVKINSKGPSAKKRQIKKSETGNNNKWFANAGEQQLLPEETTNFNRLRQSYASIRKSFRFRTRDEIENVDDDDAPEGKRLGIGLSIGSLIKRGIHAATKSNHRTLNPQAVDSIKFTDGSFKVLSAPGGSNESGDGCELRQPMIIRKSDAELEIEQRLKRSKRRAKVLPSAQYRAPGSETACDGLNLDELEEIKRDNLRLTLLRAQRRTSLSEEQLSLSISEKERDTSNGNNTCSCSAFEPEVIIPTSGSAYQAEHNYDTSKQYCSCVSISSSSFSSAQRLLLESADDEDHDDVEHADDRQKQQPQPGGSSSSRASGGFILSDKTPGTRENVASALVSSGRIETLGEKACGKILEQPSNTNSFTNSSSNTPLGVAKFKGAKESQVSGESLNVSGLMLTSKQADCCPAKLTPPMKQQQQQQVRSLTRERMQSATAVSDSKLSLVSSCSNNNYAQLLVDSVKNADCAINIELLTSSHTLNKNKKQQVTCCLSSQELLLSNGRCEDLNKAKRCQSHSADNHHDHSKNSLRKRKQVANVPVDEQDQEQEEEYTSSDQLQREVSSLEQDMMLNLNEHVLCEQDCRTAWRPLSARYNTRAEEQLSSCEFPTGEEYQQEHLYSSIYGSHNSSSGQLNEPYFQRRYQVTSPTVTASRRMGPIKHYGRADLFDKQLAAHLMSQEAHYSTIEQTFYHDGAKEAINQNNNPKRSIFKRLKHLIKPGTKSKASLNNGLDWQQRPHQSIEQLYEELNLKEAASSKGNSRWNKSATLSSRSTQNMIGNSLRYLSSSRKSINFLESNGKDKSSSGRDDSLINALKPLSGFLTLGRRAFNQNHDFRQPVGHLFVSEKKQHHQIYSERGRFGGSVDSLPSADSGLSCGNLQNSSCEENYTTLSKGLNHPKGNTYSQSPANFQHVDEQSRQVVVGKARANIDCNPCAYDKEALVFKEGDIIDILERNQTGTWIGRCNDQIGHFKFINVTEIKSESSMESEDNSEDLNSDEDEKTLVSIEDNKSNNNEKISLNGTYVTKLEIRSNNHGNSKRYRMELGKTAQQQSDDTNRRLTPSNSRRAMSIGSLNDQETATSSMLKRQQLGNCKDSGGAIMSSLEQLLLAIGLADEQVDMKRLESVGETDMRQNLQGEYSYLDKLIKFGINDLDSFSALDDWYELEQIGIVDDEHQRRILMAARIIRQASKAAKLDFVENHQFSKQTAAAAITETNQPPAVRERKFSTLEGSSNLNLNQLQEWQRNLSESEEHANEPIYVNLVSRLSGHESTRLTFSEEGEEKSIVFSGQSSSVEYKLDDSANSGDIYDKVPMKALDQQEQIESVHQANESDLNNFHIQKESKFIRKTNSINQGDHNNQSQWTNYMLALQDREQEKSTLLEGLKADSFNPDKSSVNCNKSQKDENLSMQFTRGYSIRVNSSRNQRRPNNIDLSLANSHFTDNNNIVKQQFHYLRDPVIINNIPTTEMRDHRRINGNPINRTKSSNQRIKENHTIAKETTYKQPTLQTRANIVTHSRMSPPQPSQRGKTQRLTSNNLGSQFESKSAYDLRLDLSHFFS